MRHWAAAMGMLLCLGAVHAQAHETPRLLAEKITQATVLRPPLEFVSAAVPPETESRLLWTMLSEPSDDPAYEQLQRFVVDWPQSGWTPSVRAHLGQVHRSQGRYTLALQEWENAWLATRSLTNTTGRSVAEYALAHWSQLLASLGRTEKLASLFEATAGRKWSDANYAAMFAQSHEGYETMLSYPGVSYRCGTLALSRVARALGNTNAGSFQMVDIASPSNGFCMTSLAELSEANHLGLVAVERPAGANIILPSVIHWRQNHYAAVLAKQGPLYWVMDPTFGRGQWIFEDYLNEEASGKFLVPATNVPAGWKLLAKAETDNVFGKGQPSTIHFWEDPGCNMAPGGAGAPPTATINSGGNQAVCIPCESASGMPVWWVSEPYLNLFIADAPLSYRLSDGNTWSFRWTYKQRDIYPLDSTYYPSAPPMTRGVGMTNASWTHNFLSYIRFRDTYWDALTTNKCSTSVTYTYYESMVYLSGGGVLYFSKTPAGTTLTNVASGVRLEPIAGSAPTLGGSTCAVGSDTNGFRLVYPDGSQDIYNRATRVDTNCTNPSLARSEGRAYLMMRVDAQGRTNSLCYETTTNSPVVTRVKQVVDFDGRTNSLFYTNDTYRELPTRITDPYGRSAYFNCDASGRLNTLVDTASLTNTISYQSGQDGFVNGILTPYGTTSFEHFDAAPSQSNTNQGNSGGHDRINKYISVVDRDGSREVFMYRYDSSFRPGSYATNEVPVVGLLGPDTFDNGAATSTGAVVSLKFRNSFYWGKKQMTLVSTPNATNFTTSDYLFARTKHWLDQDPIAGDVGTLISDRLSLEVAPSADGTNEGFKTWYDYTRSGTARYRVGANALIGTIATVLPDGTTAATSYDYRVGGNFTPYVRAHVQPATVLGSPAIRTSFYTYAANGIDLLSHTFPDGAVEKFGWNSRHQWIAYTNAVNDWVTFTYADARLAGSVRANGTSVSLYYYTDLLPTTNPFYRMLSYIQEWPSGRLIQFPAWTNGLPQRIVGDYGLQMTNLWDSFNRLTSQQYSDGSFISNRYDRLDLFASRDRLGAWTWFAHDAMQRLTAVTNANTNVTQYGYCGCGALESITDALTNLTTLKYDGQLRLTNVVFADSNAVFYSYDSVGRRTAQSDGSRTWTFTHNKQGLLEAVSNAFGQVQRVLYDLRDNPAQITGAAGVTVTNTFDAVNRLLVRFWPDNGKEIFGYNTNGLIRYTNQLGFGTRYAYSNGFISAVTNALGDVTRFTYTTAGDLFQLIDGRNQTNQWGRDVFGRVTNKVNASGQTVFGFGYDANNRLTSRWTPTKGTTWFTNDAVGNLRAVHYPSSTNLAFDYDPLNRVKSMTDAAGTSAFTYNKAGRLASEDGPWSNDTPSFVYAQGLRTSATLGTTWTNSYGYDAARRLDTVTSGAGNFPYQFVGASGLTRRVGLLDNVFVTNSYDRVAQLTNTTLFFQSWQPFWTHGYGYDLAGRRTSSTSVEGLRADYTYDGLGQLKSAKGIIYPMTNFGYAYDAAGNLTFRTNETTVRAFRADALNQLTNLSYAGDLAVSGVTTTNATNVTVNGVAATLTGSNYTATVPLGDGADTLVAIGEEKFGRRATNVLSIATHPKYDLNGNMLFDGKRGFAYDDENQLTVIIQTNAWKSEFTYDGLGRRRIRKEFTWSSSAWSLTNETRYVFDGLLILQERDGANAVKVTYTRGLDLSGTLDGAGGIGGLLARTDSSASAYYFSDGNGNVSFMRNPAGTGPSAMYLYEPFGAVSHSFGLNHEVNEMQFSSMLHHSQSGLSLYHARAYSPSLQRWLNADPIGEAGGINLHQFVENDPVDVNDPLGLLGNLNRPPETVTMSYEYSPIFRTVFPGGTMTGEWNPGSRLNPDPVGVMVLDLTVSLLTPWPGDEELAIARFLNHCKQLKAAKTTANIADDAFSHGFKYDYRIRARAVQDPKSHNFPYSFDDGVLATKPIPKNNGYNMFQKPGSMNGKEGVFEMGVTRDGVIDHRFFRPNK